MDYTNPASSANTSDVREVSSEGDITSQSDEKTVLNAQYDANSAGSEGPKITKIERIRRMLKAGFKPVEVAKAINSNLSYVYNAKKKIESEPKVPRVPLAIIRAEENLQEAKTRQRKETMLLQLFHTKGLVSEATKATGITYKTHLDWMKADSWYADRVLEVQEATIDYVEGQLFKQIQKGVSLSTMFYLKTKAKHRGYTERVEHTGAMTVDVRVIEPFVDLLQEQEEEQEAIEAEYTVVEQNQ